MNSTSISEWLVHLADKTPTPGGGAVAALAVAISAAQLGMVAVYTTGPKWAENEERMNELNKELGAIREEALGLVTADGEAYALVGAVYQMPKDSETEKSLCNQAMQQALVAAAEPPCAVARLAVRLIKIANELKDMGNPNVISDVAVGASVAQAALEAAIVNIEVNLIQINEAGVKNSLQKLIDGTSPALLLSQQVVDAVTQKMKGIS